MCRFIVLAVVDGGSGLEDGTDQGLQPAPPAPRGGAEALWHHRTVLVEEWAESLARNQGWCLWGGKETKWSGEHTGFKMSTYWQTRACKTRGEGQRVWEVWSLKSRVCLCLCGKQYRVLQNLTNTIHIFYNIKQSKNL